MPIIEVSNLCKTYRTFKRREGVWGSVRDLFQRDYQTLVAVDRISFSVAEGELIGYIGPNGAGKSTSIKMLTGILQPSSGEMKVWGFHPFRQRKVYTKHIGVVFGQRTQLWWDIAVQESLRLLAKIYEVSPQDYRERLAKLTEILGLAELLATPVRKLSLGQRMRCDLAASLLHNPKVLFLDEPTIGLDTVGKDSIRSFLRQVNKDFGTTILLTTHDLNEIEELCRRIIVLDHGNIIYDGSLINLKSMPGLKRSVIVDFGSSAPEEELNRVFEGKVIFEREGERRLRSQFDPAEIPAAEVIRRLLDGYEVADLSISEPSIEDVIIKIYREGVAPMPAGKLKESPKEAKGR